MPDNKLDKHRFRAALAAVSKGGVLSKNFDFKGRLFLSSLERRGTSYKRFVPMTGGSPRLAGLVDAARRAHDALDRLLGDSCPDHPEAAWSFEERAAHDLARALGDLEP